MAEIEISIGGRDFQVACRAGEEHFLQAAAKMLDNEATALKEALGRMPENRMLLMAGLMLADRTASLEDELKSNAGNGVSEEQAAKTSESLSKAQADIAGLQAQLATAEADLAKLVYESNQQASSSNASLARLVEKLEQTAEELKKAG